MNGMSPENYRHEDGKALTTLKDVEVLTWHSILDCYPRRKINRELVRQQLSGQFFAARLCPERNQAQSDRERHGGQRHWHA
jgi:hypothetical protein